MARRAARSSTKKQPEPLENVFEMQDILDSMIGEDYLKQIAGVEDLCAVDTLKITINTSVQSIHSLDELLPNLQSLILDGSQISSIRDLGVGLKSLISLSLADCALCDLDGIGALFGLRELNLSNNAITEVVSLALHDNLEVLNLSGNRIADLSVVDALSSCPKLRSLSLSRNPITKAPRYRSVIASLLPKIEFLDGEQVDHDAASKITNGMILEAASSLNVANDELEDEMRMEAFIIDATQVAAPGSNGDESILADTGSELTHGDNSVMAGGVAAAMRKRRNKQLDQSFEREETRDSCHAKTKQASQGADSALDVIDAAFQEAQSNPEQQLPSFLEGDITLAVATQLGMISSVDGEILEDATGGPLSAPASSLSPKRSTLLSSHAFSPQITKRPPSRGASTKTSRDASNRSLDGSTKGDSEQDSGARSPRPMSSSGRAGQTKRPLSRAGSGDMTDYVDPYSTISGRISQASSKASSRQSSRGSSRNGVNDSGFEPPGDDAASLHLQRLRSPYQLNASRPVTADVSAALPFLGFGSGSSAGAPNVPFIVVADEEERKQLKENASAFHRSSPLASGAGSHELFNGHTKSIVHLDLVRNPGVSAGISRPSSASGKRPSSGSGSRPQSGSSTGRPPLQHASSSGMSDNGEVDEECVTPRTTILPRISPVRRPGSGTPSVVSAYGTDDDDGEDDAAALQTLTSSSLIKFPVTGVVGLSGKPIGGTGGPITQSSMAGASLGFNLAGSLAAIEEWVDAMESDDDKPALTIPHNRGDTSDSDDQRISQPSLLQRRMKGISMSSEAVGIAAVPKSKDKKSSAADGTRVLSRDAISSMYGQEPKADIFIIGDERFHYSDDSAEEEDEKHLARSPRGSTGRISINCQDTTRSQPRELLSSKSHSSIAVGQLPAKGSSKPSTTKKSSVVPAANVGNSFDEPVIKDFLRDARQTASKRPADSNLMVSTQSSPPRCDEPVYTAGPGSIANVNTNAAPGQAQAPQQNVFGDGVFMADGELVALLRLPPKSTPALRTKSSFQEFFRGIRASRMQQLLKQAYADLDTIEMQNEKVSKRMDLLREVLT